MRSLRIGLRLALAFGLILALFIAVAWGGLQNSIRNDGLMAGIGENFEKVQLGAAIAEAAQENMQFVAELLINEDYSAIQKVAAKLEANRQRNAATVKRLDEMAFDEAGKKLYEAVKAKRSQFIEKRNGIIALLKEAKYGEGRVQFESVLQPAVNEYKAALAAFGAYQKKQVDENLSGMLARNRGNRGTVLWAVSVVVLLGGLMAFLITRSVTRPVGAARRELETIAAGDLTRVIEVRGRDEIGGMTAALAGMQRQLVATVGRIRRSSDEIDAASGQIAAGNQDLSARTEQQASSLEETASAMEQLTATVKQNAENAKQASQLATSASDVAARGGRVVGEVVATMDGISASSRKIADIIGVIDSIAFQTNILALNAAVEAARAGEQGRGFAVVATEVRGLAQKSADAAKEIKALIEDSAAKVKAGSLLVGDAGRTMEEIVSSVQRVSDIVSEITAASQEQGAGIEQVNQAIAQMDQATQSNAALVEESAAASESMKGQARALVATVAVFRLEGAAGEAATDPAARHAEPANESNETRLPRAA